MWVEKEKADCLMLARDMIVYIQRRAENSSHNRPGLIKLTDNAWRAEPDRAEIGAASS